MINLLFALAMEPAVLINEIAWMGDTDNWRNEWVELYNQDQSSINLDNWILLIDDSKTFLSGTIHPDSFFVISKDKLKGNLKNTGNYLTLLDSSNNIVDEQDFSSGWPAGDNETKRTMERSENGWKTSFSVNGTPGKKNSFIEAKNIVPSDIEISDDNGRNSSIFLRVLLSGMLISSFITIFILYLNLKPKKDSIKN